MQHHGRVPTPCEKALPQGASSIPLFNFCVYKSHSGVQYENPCARCRWGQVSVLADIAWAIDERIVSIGNSRQAMQILRFNLRDRVGWCTRDNAG
jgi:hypothetical protein